MDTSLQTGGQMFTGENKDVEALCPKSLQSGYQSQTGAQSLKSLEDNTELEMFPSCLSLKSDMSMPRYIDFQGRQKSEDERKDQVIPDVLSVQRHQADLDFTLELLEGMVMNLVTKELKRARGFLGTDNQKYPIDEEDYEDEQLRSFREAFLNLIVNLLERMKKKELVDCLRSRSRAAECACRLKRRLQKKFHSVSEGVAKAGNSAPLNQIYTELYITEGDNDQVNREHEVQQIEAATRNQARLETTIRQEELFKALPESNQPIRSLLTKGVAGIGKTLLTHKFTLDWAEQKAHQNFHFVFPFTFRELNMLKNKLSLLELVHSFFPETKEFLFSRFEEVPVLFIFDGLDESRLPLDFLNSPVLTDATESTSVDVLLTNLIKGNLLPSARLWITTRPAAADQIPPECVDMVTEVRGFTDLQKEVYFRKRFVDEEQSSWIISNIRSSRSLYIMCHIPIFCWISATVLEDMLKNNETAQLPKTLTEMYTHFVVVQSKLKKQKYDMSNGMDILWDAMSRKMGKLAYEQLQRGNVIFYESDLTGSGIDVKAASLYSGYFTQILGEERGLYQDKVYCFIHLSLQEFLAAHYVHQKFSNAGVNVFDSQQTFTLSRNRKHFYQRAIDEAVASPNGHLDLFLRFLLGLSVQHSNNPHRVGSNSWTHQDTAALIKKKISENVSPERIINLFHCLNEVKDTSLVEEVQQHLRSGNLSKNQLSAAQWSALAFILLSSDEHHDTFDLKKYSASEEALERLKLVVQASNKVLLSDCRLSERSCSLLSSVLSSPTSSVTQLDLSENKLQVSGMNLLFAGMKRSHLETLKLARCRLSEESLLLLPSVLSSSSSSLTQLDLTENKLQDVGVDLLSRGLKKPQCHLETLKLRWCDLSEKSCSLLSSVLGSSSSSLTHLDLSDNDLQDSGVELLCVGLESPHCHLETLGLAGCMITQRGCVSLALVLRSNPSHLRELDLSYNHPGGPGLEQLSEGLVNPDWRLETLRVDHCGPHRLESRPASGFY